MRKIASVVILTSLLVTPLIGLAQGSPEAPPEVTDIWVVLDTIRDWLFGLLLTIAVILLIVGAYRFMTAGGDPVKLTSARDNIMWGLVGVAVAFLARGLVTLIRSIITG